MAADLSHAVTPETARTLDGLLRERVRRTPEAVAYRDFNRVHANWRDFTFGITHACDWVICPRRYFRHPPALLLGGGHDCSAVMTAL